MSFVRFCRLQSILTTSRCASSLCARPVNFNATRFWSTPASSLAAATAQVPVTTAVTSRLSQIQSSRWQQQQHSQQQQQCVSMSTTTSNSGDRMVWVDLEMTGLDDLTDHIIEMACVITDGDLNIVAEGPELVIHQSDEVLDNMNAWCVEHHGKSGLTQRVRESKLSLEEAEKGMVAFVSKHIPAASSTEIWKRPPLAGNSVHADKRFLDRYMKNFTELLHYRIVDVSTVKELGARWYPDLMKNAPRKAGSHRALDDILESVAELAFYRKALFVGGGGDGAGAGGASESGHVL
eukprot:TRINITY_DN1227_c0_g4_i1.p1 TRINITY_DN1227_c0_g4~~TRINITY_DN1227_c0_g4_i1.p1  ORF type:complete len:293 (-),score=58.75 TRINITY_DN1227_c0_g4_i1:365-1243(-)